MRLGLARIGEILQILLHHRRVLGRRFLRLVLRDGVAILGFQATHDLRRSIATDTGENIVAISLRRFPCPALSLLLLSFAFTLTLTLAGLRQLTLRLPLSLSLALALRLLLNLGHGLGKTILRLLHRRHRLLILCLRVLSLGLHGLRRGSFERIGRLLQGLLRSLPLPLPLPLLRGLL